MFVTELIRKVARRAGYQIQKYPKSAFSPVPVFDLAVRQLMTLKGTQLSFVQVGANDGCFGDPLHKYIVRWPWHGVLVEPQPDVFNKLCQNYAAFKDRLIFENVAIGMRSSLELYIAPSSSEGQAEYPSSVVSARPSLVATQLGIGVEDLQKITVPCLTLNELAKRHRMTHIDVLQIDAEGQDYEILKTLNLLITRPLLIQFEHGHLSPGEVDGVVHYLASHDYRVLYGGHQVDSIAVSKEFISLID